MSQQLAMEAVDRGSAAGARNHGAFQPGVGELRFSAVTRRASLNKLELGQAHELVEQLVAVCQSAPCRWSCVMPRASERHARRISYELLTVAASAERSFRPHGCQDKLACR